MRDLTQRVFQAEPGKLAFLFEADWERADNWRAEELGAILRHQLAASLEVDIPGTQRRPGKRHAEGMPGRSRCTFGELLHQPLPHVELLRLVKDFAKANLRRAESLLPREIAHLLYYASLIAARCRCGQRISTLRDEALLEGIEWVLSQSWVDPKTRELFAAGRARLHCGDR